MKPNHVNDTEHGKAPPSSAFSATDGRSLSNSVLTPDGFYATVDSLKSHIATLVEAATLLVFVSICRILKTQTMSQ